MDADKEEIVNSADISSIETEKNSENNAQTENSETIDGSDTISNIEKPVETSEPLGIKSQNEDILLREKIEGNLNDDFFAENKLDELLEQTKGDISEDKINISGDATSNNCESKQIETETRDPKPTEPILEIESDNCESNRIDSKAEEVITSEDLGNEKTLEKDVENPAEDPKPGAESVSEHNDEEDKIPEIESVELVGSPEKMSVDNEEPSTSVLDNTSNEIEEVNPIDTSGDNKDEENIEKSGADTNEFANDTAEENSKDADDSKCLDESSVDKDDQQPANTIEYVDFQDGLDEDRSKDLDDKDCISDSATEPMQVDENPLLLNNDNSTLNKDDLEEEQDPIGADTFVSDTQQGADEELCIIPDTDRVISEAEKEAAISIPPLKDITQTSETSDPTEDTASVSEASADELTANKFVIKKYNVDKQLVCTQCTMKRKPKYVVNKDGSQEHLCTDNCLDMFRQTHEGNCVMNLEGEIRVKNLTAPSKVIPKLNFERKCAVCFKKTDDEEKNLTWEIMDFCNEYCLSKYQKEIGSVCASCTLEVRANSLGKYCVRFGNDIRQFCSSHCLEEYKKGLKVCSYCQHDMSIESDGFLAPVGDKGQFKDFCSQVCMEKYDVMTNNRPPKVAEGTKCSVCKSDNTITIEYKVDDTYNYFCGEPCFVAFSFVKNITPAKCSMCRRYFPNEVLEKNTMFYDNVQYGFCSNSCQNIYIVAHRKIVPCAWCKVKKYNFDMIRRYFKNGPVINMCSINCLSFFQVSINAVHSKKTICNYCNKTQQPMYHLTMSDATIRNFCSYNCVMSFQNKFKKSPITLNETEVPVPTGEPKKNKKFTLSTDPPAKTTSPPPLPVITNVQSLAKNDVSTPTRITRNKTNANSHIINSTVEAPVKIKHHFIIKPATPPDQRNVATMCKVKKLNKSTTIKPIVQDRGIQTDKREADKILIPIPVPVYIPSPLPMYSVPAPYPLPFPIPIPVPIFIPTTRNSAKGIMKEIKKIQVKIPTDPYEAELLMMAEMVAGEKKGEDNTDSESDVDDTAAGDDGTFSPEPVDASNAFGEDMLQMALKMATEGLEEPAVDLEGALTANTITAPQGSETASEENVDDPQPMLQMGDRPTSFRGRKRGRGSKGSAGTKRRRITAPVEMQPIPPQPIVPPEPTEKPDAHLCLKYTFGVNAWKQWVTTKNAELEKQTKYVKPFKTEILQLTADELNFSLCLFVKEVRKPNGAEYAPDTIYYLCLGIQQYLFENNRIDNIFCDPYYEQFTDSLDEVARKFSVLYNDSHYIVTRVEEEHLWESKQLGAHSPHVLLSTLMFFNTKHFNLTSVQEHMQLSFSHIMKHWKRNPNLPGVARTPGSRNVLLRFYPPQSAIQNNTRKKKVYEQQENDENPLRCPVKLYEFYLSKCPESVKTRNDVFYLQPERSCVPDSPVWYSTTALPQEALEKMLHRVKMVKEINVALLTS